MKAYLTKHRLAFFFVLAFLLSWYPWIIALLRGRTTGPNPLGPFVAGIIVTAVVAGGRGLRIYFAQLIRVRVAPRWYLATFLLPIMICLVAIGLTVGLFHSTRPALPTPEKLRELPDRFLFILLFIGLGEEPGWRGFALPHLQSNRSPFAASLILAPIWALWHLPLMGNEFPWPIVPAFLLSLGGATFALTAIYNGSRGSVLLPMLFHATVNTVGAGLLFPLFSGGALLALWWLYAILWLGTGLWLVSRRCSESAQEGLPFRPSIRSPSFSRA